MSHVFSVKLILRFADHMTINRVIGIHVTWHVGANGEWPLSWHHYRDIIIMTSFILPSPRWRIHKTISKNTPDFAINLHIFLFDFSKAITCFRNDAVLHVYFNLKCNENWRKAAYHASSDSGQRVVSYALCVCVWCQTSEFCTGHFTP